MESFPSLQTVGILATAVTLVICILRRALLPKPLPGIPYNPTSATRLMGDGPEVFAWQAKHGDMFSYLPHLAQKLNSPIFQVFLRPGGKPWVMLTDHRESHDIMTRRFRDFDRSEFFGDNFKAALPEFQVHYPTGEKWHEHRKLVGETMSPWFLNGVAAPIMWGTTQSLMALWREKVRLAGQDGVYDVQGDVHKGAMDIIWAATFGDETGSNKAQAEHLKGVKRIEKGSHGMMMFSETEDPPAFTSIITLTQSLDIPVRSLFPRWHHWFALNFYPSLVAARKHKDRAIRNKLEEAKVRLSAKTADDLESTAGLTCALDLVVAKELKAAVKQGRKPNYNSQDIQDELFGFLIGGHETTSTTINWALKLLTEHQTTQSKFRAALRSAFPKAVSESRQPTTSEITSAHIPYLEALMEEVARCGLTSLGQIRKTLRDTEILGHRIPAGIDVFMLVNGPGYLSAGLEIDEMKRSTSSQAAKDKMPEWQEDDIGAFKVERWLKENGEFDGNAGPNTPFGKGPRACFGKKWAMLEMRILLVLIFWNFELLPIPEALRDQRAIDGVTHRPENVRVRMRAL